MNKSILGLMSIVWALTACRKHSAFERSATAYETDPQATPAALDVVDRWTAKLAVDLLRDHDPKSNFVVSPLGVSVALGMLYAGAHGPTAHAIQRTLQGSAIAAEDFHRALNRRVRDLVTARSSPSPERPDEARIETIMAQSIWLQDGRRYTASFLDALGRHYDAPGNLVDFETDRATAAARMLPTGVSSHGGVAVHERPALRNSN